MIHYLDVGAANDTRELAWRLVDDLRFTLIEPDPDAAERLRQIVGNSRRAAVLQVALSHEPQNIVINMTRKPEVSSVYIPNREFLDRFPDSSRFDVVGQNTHAAITIDELLPQIGSPDFIKLDTQGSELSILRGASTALENCIGLLVEVEFVHLYLEQPLYCDVFNLLTQTGFEFIDFTTIYRYGRSSLDRTGQAVFADALFLRSPESLLEERGAVQSLSKLETIARVYEKYDIAVLCRELASSNG